MNEYTINGLAKVIITQKSLFRKKLKQRKIEIPFIEWIYADSEEEAFENTKAYIIFNWNFPYKGITWLGNRFLCGDRMFLEGKKYKRVTSMVCYSIDWKIKKVISINNWSVQKCKEWLTPKEFERHIRKENLIT